MRDIDYIPRMVDAIHFRVEKSTGVQEFTVPCSELSESVGMELDSRGDYVDRLDDLAHLDDGFKLLLEAWRTLSDLSAKAVEDTSGVGVELEDFVEQSYDLLRDKLQAYLDSKQDNMPLLATWLGALLDCQRYTFEFIQADFNYCDHPIYWA